MLASFSRCATAPSHPAEAGGRLHQQVRQRVGPPAQQVMRRWQACSTQNLSKSTKITTNAEMVSTGNPHNLHLQQLCQPYQQNHNICEGICTIQMCGIFGKMIPKYLYCCFWQHVLLICSSAFITIFSRYCLHHPHLCYYQSHHHHHVSVQTMLSGRRADGGNCRKDFTHRGQPGY